DHGPAPPRAPGPGRAIPPRIDPQPARARAAEELPRRLRRRRRSRARHEPRHAHHPPGSPPAHHRAPRDLRGRDVRPHAPGDAGRGLAADDRRDHDRAAGEEGDGGRDHRRGARHARAGAQGGGGRPHPPGRHRRHRRRRRQHLQHLRRDELRDRARPRPGAKHGGRSVSSASGSADAYEALGAAIELAPAAVAESIARTGIGFMYAPAYHPAMKVVAPVRREMGVRTLFNILGPLTNPAGAPSILMGVFHPDLVGIQVRVLQELGAERALVAWGRDGMDEISLGAATMIGELRDGEVREYEVHPEDFGIAMAHTRNLRVADAAESKAMLLQALDNVPSLQLEIVALNAGAALYVAGV